MFPSVIIPVVKSKTCALPYTCETSVCVISAMKKTPLYDNI